MTKETVFNFKCDKKCVVHTLATHNTCWNCSAIRNSPYFQEETKNMSDEEILETRDEINKECEMEKSEMTDEEKAEEYYEDNECYSYLSEVEDFEEVFGFVKDRIKKAYLDGVEKEDIDFCNAFCLKADKRALLEQIERMKCFGNCKHSYSVNTGGCYDTKCELTGCDCINCKDKWEMDA